jgi:hypothetical protein
MGLGCTTEGINLAATVCIRQSTCGLTISTASGGAGLSGSATIDSAGDFANAAIVQGSSTRGGCIGTYDEVSKQLTVTCGGTAPCGAANGQCCEVVLTPKSGGGC